MKDVSHSGFEKFIHSKGMKINKGFVYPPVEESETKKFEIDGDRIKLLSQVVKFLEQQRHDFSSID
jgi:hypothetical protein